VSKLFIQASRTRVPQSGTFWTRRPAVTKTLADRDLLIRTGGSTTQLWWLVRWAVQSDRLDQSVGASRTSLVSRAGRPDKTDTPTGGRWAYRNAAAGSSPTSWHRREAVPEKRWYSRPTRRNIIAMADQTNSTT